MNPPAVPPDAPPLGPPVRLGRTLRFATREAWDSLGLVCLASFTVFAGTLFPFLTLVGSFGRTSAGAVNMAGWAAALAVALFLFAPLYAGACWMANVAIEKDEPGYADLWRGAKRLLSRALALGAIQAMVTLLLVSNLAFYLAQRSFLFLILAVLFLYALAFWASQAIYHFPLLVAAERGLLKRSDDGPTPIPTLLRNALVMALASPGYSLGIAAFLAVLGTICLATGAGIALLFAGYTAFVTVQATRDQLVRFNHLDPPPDPDEPVPDERWRVAAGSGFHEGDEAREQSS